MSKKKLTVTQTIRKERPVTLSTGSRRMPEYPST